MKKALRVLYLIIGAVVAAILLYVGTLDELKETFEGMFPDSVLAVISVIIWVTSWPLILILALYLMLANKV